MAGKAVILSLASGTPIFQANPHSKYVVRARWSACGHYFATASYDRTVQLYGPSPAAGAAGSGAGGSGSGGGATTIEVAKSGEGPFSLVANTHYPDGSGGSSGGSGGSGVGGVAAAAAAASGIGEGGGAAATDGRDNVTEGGSGTAFVLLKTLHCTGPVESLAFTPATVPADEAEMVLGSRDDHRLYGHVYTRAHSIALSLSLSPHTHIHSWGLEILLRAYSFSQPLPVPLLA